jgi:hypothetical protein
MQTSTARDVAMTPPQCPTTEAGQTDKNGRPIPYFQKEFFHNGYIRARNNRARNNWSISITLVSCTRIT